MRGTPGGKQLITGSLLWARETLLGPTFGLAALNLAKPQGVMGGSSLEMDMASSKIVYFRELSGGLRERRQMPARFGVAALCVATPFAGCGAAWPRATWLQKTPRENA